VALNDQLSEINADLSPGLKLLVESKARSSYLNLKHQTTEGPWLIKGAKERKIVTEYLMLSLGKHVMRLFTSKLSTEYNFSGHISGNTLPMSPCPAHHSSNAILRF
jgi:hypothetical protein